MDEEMLDTAVAADAEPEVCEEYADLTTEELAQLDEAIEASKHGAWYVIDDPRAYVDELWAKAEATVKGVGDGAACRTDR